MGKLDGVCYQVQKYFLVQGPVGVKLIPKQSVVELLVMGGLDKLTENLRDVDKYSFFVQLDLKRLQKRVDKLFKTLARQRTCDHLHLFAIDRKVVEL